MARLKGSSIASLAGLLLCMAALGPTAAAAALLKAKILTANDPAFSAQPIDFTSREEAETFLAKTLPAATKANPKYRSNNGALTQWLTKEVVFGRGASANGLSVAMKEDILEFRDGRQSATGTHDVRFLIEDVQISELMNSGDLTENGEEAWGVYFRCNSGKCIEAKWNGVPTPSEQADISIQDKDTRSKILAAFQALKRFAGDRAKQ